MKALCPKKIKGGSGLGFYAGDIERDCRPRLFGASAGTLAIF